MTRPNDAAHGPATWLLRLYVTGMTATAQRALSNLTAICEQHLAGHYAVEVIDLLERPALADVDQILAIPTLVRCQPQPTRKIIGDLSSTDKVLVALELPGAR